MEVWSGILDSCPGLLCCVVNIKGRLVYATKGYKAIAARVLGHKCDIGRNYPPLITETDKTLHECLTAACLGKINAIEVSENGRIWEITAAPLKITSQKVEGVVIRLIRSEGKTESPSPAIVRTNPDVLNAVPFRACVVDSSGLILSANKFLSAGFNTSLISRKITDVVEPDSEDALTEVLTKRSGKVECRMYEAKNTENFYTFDEEIYLDDELNPKKDEHKESDTDESRHVRLHASPIDWDDRKSIMLTFEDVTEYTRTHEQLRRLLTYEPGIGILNRRGIQHTILHELGASIMNADHMSLIMLNIDDFRSVNKSKGYMAANRVLRDFVSAAKKFLSGYENVSIGRWSGDEFLVLAHCSGASAVVMADGIRKQARDIAISAGAADLSAGGYVSVNEFIGAAYDAMVEAKESGGNTTVLARKK